jgi:hypothetical protein
MNDSRRTFGPASLRIGVLPSHLNKLAKRHLIPFESAGRFRLVKVEDLPARPVSVPDT